MAEEARVTTEKAKIEVTDWWITDDFLSKGGRKVMGPFMSRDLAIEVRTMRETIEGRWDYFVDSEVRHVER